MPYPPTRKRDRSRQRQVKRNRSEQERKADAFDRQIEEDVKAGKLDALMERAREQSRKGETRRI